ncbi:MAG: DUF2330 domain-containing protein [Armatimonadota bacterium]
MKRFLTTFALFAAYQSWACCGVGKSRVYFGGQQDIVIWDDSTQTEHFVRKASFQSTSPEMGFIAPSPSVPELKAASTRAFRTIEDHRPVPVLMAAAAGEATMSKAAVAGGIEVAQIVEVGNYEATTLRSDDPAALTNYLNQNGYQASQDIEEWTQFYLKKKWYLTAFKLKKKSERTELEPIRMSFKTDRPFFPYLVPASNQGKPAKLQVFLLSSGVGSATAEGVVLPKPSWDAPLFPGAVPGLLDDLTLPPGALDHSMHITGWDDLQFPSSATDDGYLHIHSIRPLWLDLGAYVLVGFAGVYGYRRFRLARSKQKIAND